MVSLPGRPTERDITLFGGGTLAGVIRLAGPPAVLPGVRVILTEALGQVVSTILTAEDGRYELTNLAEGSYTLAASAAGYHPVTRSVTLSEAASQPPSLRRTACSRTSCGDGARPGASCVCSIVD